MVIKSPSIRPYLEMQANTIETVLAAHRAPGRITGGEVGPRQIRFFLQPAPQVRQAAVKALAEDLATAIRVPSLRVVRGTTGGIVLEFPHPSPRPVSLLDLLPNIAPYPETGTLLGMTVSGTPLLARLAAPEVSHILVAGTTGSGKTALMRTMAATLLVSHKPDSLRIVFIDPKGRSFREMTSQPHLIEAPIRDMERAAELLASLVQVMETRDQNNEQPGAGIPRIALFIDELADLLMQDNSGQVQSNLTRLLQRGREAGIHVIAATQRPSAAILDGLMRANFPLRLVGKVVSPEDSRIATARPGAGANLLDGKGDFLAVTGSADPIRFQVAFITGPDLQTMMDRQPNRPAPVFALPAADETGEPDNDLLALQAQAEEKGRAPRSINEAAEWLFGAGTSGGAFFYRARAAFKNLGFGSDNNTTRKQTPVHGQKQPA